MGRFRGLINGRSFALCPAEERCLPPATSWWDCQDHFPEPTCHTWARRAEGLSGDGLAEAEILYPVGNHRVAVALGDKVSLESFDLNCIARSMRLADRNPTLGPISVATSEK